MSSAARGAAYLTILAELVEEDSAALDPEVLSALERMGGYESYALVARRCPPMPDDIRNERLSLVAAFIMRAVADRGRSQDRATPGRAQLEQGPFTANLVAMVTAMLSAPVP